MEHSWTSRAMALILPSLSSPFSNIQLGMGTSLDLIGKWVLCLQLMLVLLSEIAKD